MTINHKIFVFFTTRATSHSARRINRYEIDFVFRYHTIASIVSISALFFFIATHAVNEFQGLDEIRQSFVWAECVNKEDRLIECVCEEETADVTYIYR